MKFFALIFILLCLQSQAQITGNPHVKDSSALKLNSTAVESLLGKWRLVRTVEYLHSEEQSRDRGLLVSFGEGGTLTTSWCIDCEQEKGGTWEVINEQTLKFSGGSSQESRYLAGDYAVYSLTENEMILAKVLTSSGDWRKFQYFSRNISNPPITEIKAYCINCLTDGAWCMGDKPDKAKQYWLLVNLDSEKDRSQIEYTASLLESYDWLLENTPCLDVQLYMKAISFYESLLAAEKEEQAIKYYQEKIKQTRAQQQLYFKN